MDDKELQSLLFSAIHHHNESLLDDLLRGEDGFKLLDLPGEDGSTLLHAAVKENDLKCVKCLLKHGADPNVFDGTRSRSPLHLAIGFGFNKIVAAFLELQHVNLDLRDDRNLTCHEIAQLCDNQKLADFIQERQAETEKLKDDFYTVMNQACTSNDSKLVRELLARYERKIIQTMPKSWNHHKDKKSFARNILKDLINWTSSSWNDVTLLFKSASKGYTDICKLLIEFGATSKSNENTNYSPLYVAAYGGHTSTVRLLLDCFPALIQKTTKMEKWTVLHSCCLQGHSETAKLLLNYPYPDSLKQCYITRSGQYEYKFAFDLNLQDAAGQTVIYLAVSANNESLLDTLLEFKIQAHRILSSAKPKDDANNQRQKLGEARLVCDQPMIRATERDAQFHPSNQINRIMKQLRKLQFSREGETVSFDSTSHKAIDSDNMYLICPFELDTYCDYNSKTALHLAICQQYHNIATTLLVNGSNPNLPILFKDLVKNDRPSSAEPDVGVGWLRTSKSTCLKEACKLNDETMCEILIRYGARDTSENLALQVAATYKNHSLISMFLSLKSNLNPEYKINRKCYKQNQDVSTKAPHTSNTTTTFSSMFPSTSVSIDWQNLRCIQHIDPQWLIDASLVHNKRLRHPTNSLMAITRLDLSSNNLKTVHSAIFRLPSLRELNLSSNRLESLLDVTRMSQDSSDSRTPTSRLIESQRTAMKRSKSSHFSGSNLDPTNLLDISELQEWDLPFLEVLDLHDNLLMALPDCLFELPKLTELDVSSNQLRQLPWAMWTAPSLRELIASGNLLDDLPKVPPHSRNSSGLSSPMTTLSSPLFSENNGERSSFRSSERSCENLESSMSSSLNSDLGQPSYLEKLRDSGFDVVECEIKPQRSQLKHINNWTKRIDLVDESTLQMKDDPNKASFSRLTFINLSHNSFIMIPPVLACVATELNRLNMSYNRIESLGDLSLYPAKLKTLDLSNNRLMSWFHFSTQDDDTKHCYIENVWRHPSAKFRGHGQLYCVHKIHQRLDQLRSLNLSHNLLRDIKMSSTTPTISTRPSRTSGREADSSVPANKQASLLYPNITALDVSFNHIQRVADGMSDLKDLSVLNLSGNPSITVLPAELGLANKLWNLNVGGCMLSEPLKSIVESKTHKTMDIIGYLRSILEEAKPYARMKLMLVGLQGIGKTSLLEQMRSEGSSGSRRRAPEHWTRRMGHTPRTNLRNQKGVTLSTVGVDIHDWIYQKRVPRGQHNFGPVSFSTWDFGGQEEFYATHRYFLSKRSVYLVVWRLTDGIDGILSIQQWLVNIQSRAPGSPVIIVGTHEDMVEGGERGEMVNQLRAEVYKRFIDVSDHDKCGLPRIMDSIVVSTRTKLNIKNLCNRIYDVVFSLRCQGSTERLLEQKIPATYLYLEEIICWIVHDRQQNKREPVLTYEEYRKLTSTQLKLKYNKTFRDLEPLDSCDINYNSELQQATRFLHENGVLLHYHDSNLRDLYFLDPQWLCDILSHVVTIREINPYVKNGLMKVDDLGFLFKSMEVNLSGGVQSYVVNLLNKFEVALTWNSQYLLIPSLLPSRPDLLDEHVDFHVKSAPKMRGRSAVRRTNLSGIQLRSTSIGPAKRSNNTHGQSTKNFYEFEYRPENAITRLVMLRYLPAGFLARLQSGILSDPIFDEACEELHLDLVNRVAKEEGELDIMNILGGRTSWLCWKKGLRLTLQQETTINTKRDPELLAPNLLTIQEHSVDSPDFPFGQCNFKIECVQLDPVDKQEETMSTVASSQWVDFDIGQYSNIIAIVLPNPILKVMKKEDRTTKTYELDHLNKSRLLAKAVDYIDDLLEDWYPSLGARFAHTLGGNYLVTRVVLCRDCSCQLPLVDYSTQTTPGQRPTRIGRSSRLQNKQGIRFTMNNSSAQTMSDSHTKEIHCYYIEHCILNAYDLNASLTHRRMYLQSPKKSSSKARNLQCPRHGSFPVSSVAPDIVFDDVLDSLKIDNNQIDRYKLIGRGALGFVFKASLASPK